MIRSVLDQRLFIGNALDARNVPSLHQYDIRAVVDLAINEAPAALPRDFIYCRFPLNDGGGNESVFLSLAIESVMGLVRSQKRTLVACSAGMSRSPVICAAAMAVVLGRDPDECLLEVVANAPHDVSPLLWTDVKSVCRLLSW